MRILATIANYGIKNDEYLRQVIAEYRSMSHSVDIVVLTNIRKDLGPAVEVVVVDVTGIDPHTLPFAHKRIFAERLHAYDLFIYSEDDTLITERNLSAFLEASEVLPKDELAGFLNTETGPAGDCYFCNVSSHFHWDPSAVKSRGRYTFAFFTNEHSACFVLTQAQLSRAIESGGFLVEPHEGKYDLECSASTDPYTQCGFKKMICVSHLDGFLVRHLPGKYRGRPHTTREEVDRQIEALLEIQLGIRPPGHLINPETAVLHANWSKRYYEPVRADVVSLIPKQAKTILSIGCAWGATEGCLVRRGLRVVGLPMDSVIAACLEAKGVETVCGDLNTARERLDNRRFDCILLLDMLHLARNPTAVVSAFADLLSPGGIAIVTVPNLSGMSVQLRRVLGKAQYQRLGSYELTRLHMTSGHLVGEWFRQCQLHLTQIIGVIAPQHQQALRASFGLARLLLAEELIAVGRKV